LESAKNERELLSDSLPSLSDSAPFLGYCAGRRGGTGIGLIDWKAKNGGLTSLPLMRTEQKNFRRL